MIYKNIKKPNLKFNFLMSINYFCSMTVTQKLFFSQNLLKISNIDSFLTKQQIKDCQNGYFYNFYCMNRQKKLYNVD